MDIKIIEHTLRPIRIPYHQDLPWSDADQQLCDAFLCLHDICAGLNVRGNALLAGFGELDKHIEDVRLQLEGVATLIADAGKAADAVYPAFLFKMTGPADTLAQALTGTAKAIGTFAEHVAKLAKHMDQLTPEQTSFLDDIERDNEEAWEAVRTAHQRLYEEEGHSIDYVAFDTEDEHFRGAYSFHRTRWESSLNLCEATVKNYNMLMLEIRMQYAIWEELNKRNDLLILVMHRADPGNKIVQN